MIIPEKKPSSLLIIFAICVPVLFALSAIAIYGLFPDWQTRGQFGDMFGAINTLFTCIALIGVLYTVYLQYRQIKTQDDANTSTLNSMGKQLREMQLARVQQAQPLPVMNISKMIIKKPRFFYSPPEDKYATISKYIVEYSIGNHSAYPAINIDAKAFILLPVNDKGIPLNTIVDRYNIIPPSQDNGSEIKGRFDFDEDRGKCDMIDIIRTATFRRLPLLCTRVTFKNVLGSCFGINRSYCIDANSEDYDSHLSHYQSVIKTYGIEFKSEIEQLHRYSAAKNNEKWDALFEKVKKKTLQKRGPNEIPLRFIEQPDLFRFEILSDDAFEKEQSQSQYGSIIPMMQQECPAKKAKKE